MDKEFYQVLGIIILIIVIVAAIPIGIGYHNAQLIKEYISQGMEPYKASCLVTHNQFHCLAVPK